MGDCFSQSYEKDHKMALKCYKKVLEQAWISNDLSCEIKAYEKISVQYYYIGDLQRSKYYHEKALRGETIDDDLRRVFKRQSDMQKQRSDSPYMSQNSDEEFQHQSTSETINILSQRRKCLGRKQTSMNQSGFDVNKIINFKYERLRVNYEAYEEVYNEIQRELELLYQYEQSEKVKSNDIQSSYQLLEDCGKIYSDHLARGVGPVLRIGTPISDMSLSEFPSPRGIKDTDGNNFNESSVKNVLEEDETDKIEDMRLRKLIRQIKAKSKFDERLNIVKQENSPEIKEKKVNILEGMREQRKLSKKRGRRNQSINLDQISTKYLYDRANEKKQDLKLLARGSPNQG
eukprot:403344892